MAENLLSQEDDYAFDTENVSRQDSRCRDRDIRNGLLVLHKILDREVS
jgi:hypothetical protein